jgi:DNA-binding NarL/FixJ family response regulator
VRPTILIVDDHADFRSSARLMLETEGFLVVGEAADGSGAVEATERLRPAVVLLDIQLPDVDGFVVARRLAARPDPPEVVFISSRDRESYGRRIAGSPARGFLAKSDLSGEALATMLDLE